MRVEERQRMKAERKKRILNVLPIVSRANNEAAGQQMERYLSPGFELHHTNVAYGGMESIEGLYYMAVTVPYIVDEILKGEEDGYDAVIVNCVGNPGVNEARELVHIPVVGAGEAAYYLALILGSRLGVIEVGGTYRTPSHSAMMYDDRRWVSHLGLSERIISMRATGLPVEDLGERDVVMQALCNAGRECIDDGAEALILGCTGMTGYAEELQENLDVPVVDPSVAAVKFAEMLVTMNLTHSKLTIPSPRLVGAKCEMKYPPSLRGYHG